MRTRSGKRSARTIGAAAGLLWVGALLAGCGGGGGGVAASCGKVAPCGGSLLGTWLIASFCEAPTFLTGGTACPAATIDESQYEVTGVLTFNADMTFATSIAQSGTLRFSVPLACLTKFSGCDEFASLITPAPPAATTTCTTINATCVCATVYAGTLNSSSSGTYTNAGSVFTTTDDVGNTADLSYCVQGNTLHVVNVDATTGKITEDIVATRPGMK